MAQATYSRGQKTEDLKNDYEGFLKKFEPKKTTDDCYTPVYIYEVVADYVERTYHLDRSNFVRPFYPGGDYEHFEYKEGAVVVDNPPFSILSKIIKFYLEEGIPFFLFAPGLTTFSSFASSCCCCLCVGYSIEYDNKAKVSTSFITNMEPDIRCRTAPDLYEALEKAEEQYKEENTIKMPKYAYPDNLVTPSMLIKYSKYGVDFAVERSGSYRVETLDAQRPYKKIIYGYGYLISNKAAAEKAAAEKAAAEKTNAIVWELSPRELEIIKNLDA